MVNFCAVVGCGNRSDRDKGTHFFRLPSVITHQGEKTHDLSMKRRDLWLARIHKEDLGPEKYIYTRVCSRHFVTGEHSDLYDETNRDWAPSRYLGGAPEPASAAEERYRRTVERKGKRKRIETCDALLSLSTMVSSYS